VNDQKNESPLRGRYLVRNRGWNAALRVSDTVLSSVVRHEPRTRQATRRILIAIGGHLGDAVIATSVLPSLATMFPDAAIGMLLPSWSRAVVEGHPRLRWIHHADHWKMNRSASSVAAKWRRHRATANRVVRELAMVHYDVAVDLYAYYPNAAWLLWRSGIPTRIGYTSGGCGPLYTAALDWHPYLGHTAMQHRRLIRELGDEVVGSELRYDLPPITAEANERATGHVRGGYIVVHPGTGDRRKAWPSDRWSQLVGRLIRAGERVVVTGRGEDDQRVADDLEAVHAGVTNLVGILDWSTFRAVVANGAMLIGADSVAAHVGAAEGVPTVAIMAAMSDPEYWRPLGSDVVVLSRALHCSPCFRKHGCASMACVRDVTVDEVFAAYLGLGDASRRYVGAGRVG
jgi:ADP-heptose:LPS heptosyltransferase